MIIIALCILTYTGAKAAAAAAPPAGQRSHTKTIFALCRKHGRHSFQKNSFGPTKNQTQNRRCFRSFLLIINPLFLMTIPLTCSESATCRKRATASAQPQADNALSLPLAHLTRTHARTLSGADWIVLHLLSAPPVCDGPLRLKLRFCWRVVHGARDRMANPSSE